MLCFHVLMQIRKYQTFRTCSIHSQETLSVPVTRFADRFHSMSSNNADGSTPRTEKASGLDLLDLLIGGDDDVAETPTLKKPRASIDSGEKPKKARADDLNPLEKLFLKEYEMDEVGGSWESFAKRFKYDKVDESLTHSVATQVAADPLCPASAMYGHMTHTSDVQPKSLSLSLSPERPAFSGPQILYYKSGTLDMELSDAL